MHHLVLENVPLDSSLAHGLLPPQAGTKRLIQPVDEHARFSFCLGIKWRIKSARLYTDFGMLMQTRFGAVIAAIRTLVMGSISFDLYLLSKQELENLRNESDI